jgi:hypothetical protein
MTFTSISKLKHVIMPAGMSAVKYEEGNEQVTECKSGKITQRGCRRFWGVLFVTWGKQREGQTHSFGYKWKVPHQCTRNQTLFVLGEER